MRCTACALALVACSQATPPPATSIAYLPATAHLARAAMALRGVRPSLDELQAVAADPSQLPAIVDRYLDSPEFGATVRELHDEYLLVKIERPDYTMPPVTPLGDVTFHDMADSVYDEPLRLIEDVVMTDQPYTTIVTADYTMADRNVAMVWGMAHDDTDAWQPTAWPDDRGAAGILASSALHLRYRSTASNFNRGRANAVARGLLCHDFLAGDVRLDTSIDLADPDATSKALVKNPACAACHQTLDPLASYFWGFEQGTNPLGGIAKWPFTTYSDTTVDNWWGTTWRPPSYFGHDAVGLAGLGQAIAADPRFARCAAVHFAAYLTEVAPRDLPAPWIDRLTADFVAGGYRAKQLARAIVLSDAFRVASDADPTGADALVGYQKVRPAQLRRMLAALTGYDWTTTSADMLGEWRVGTVPNLDDDYTGFRVLAGGIDGYYVTAPVHTMNATSSLVARRAAYFAARHVVDHDAAVPAAERRLFVAASAGSADEQHVRAELVYLHARLYGELVRSDDPAIDDGYALFRSAYAYAGTPQRAWTIVLAGMLSDLRSLYY
jgi:hypothetical protein